MKNPENFMRRRANSGTQEIAIRKMWNPVLRPIAL